MQRLRRVYTVLGVMTQPKAEPVTKSRQFVFRVDPELVNRFREVAEANHRTVSQELRHLMEQRIADHAHAADRSA